MRLDKISRTFNDVRGFPRVRINPGEYCVSGRNTIVYTILGSCVSACLYDPVRKIIGMNHFLLSNRRYARNLPFPVTEAGRYGIHAMELLINAMLKEGARREDLQAKAFGGGTMLSCSEGRDNFNCVGEVNTRFVQEFLKNEGIPLVSADLGGNRGRVVYFFHDDFSVYVRKVEKTTTSKLVDKEKQIWKRSLAIQEQKTEEPELWL